jgi:hypothetical protein
VAKIYCKVSSDNNVDFEILWYHDNNLLDDRASHRINLDSDGKPLRLIKKQRSLVIYSLGPNDADDGGILEVPKSGTSQVYDFGLAIPR